MCSHVLIPLGLQSKFMGLILVLHKQLLENERITQRFVNIYSGTLCRNFEHTLHNLVLIYTCTELRYALWF